jgi:hypothetical protein
MLKFVKTYVSAIPLALGLLLTLFSIVNAMDLYKGDNAIASILLGLIGIPLLYASILSLIQE